jgi:DNA-binding MarR family transcriptional regulator
MHNGIMQTAESTGTGSKARVDGGTLGVILEQLVRLVRQLTTKPGLGTAATTALFRLLREGPLRLTDLAHAEGISQPGMTQLVTRMEREGLVHRTVSSDDRRAVLVAVTDAGRDFMIRRRAERAEVLQKLLDDLEPHEQSAIAAAIPALLRLVEQRPQP